MTDTLGAIGLLCARIANADIVHFYRTKLETGLNDLLAPIRTMAVGDTVTIGNTEWTVGAKLIAPRPPHDTLGYSDGDDGA